MFRERQASHSVRRFLPVAQRLQQLPQSPVADGRSLLGFETLSVSTRLGLYR
jgi:hypothetical protein